MRPSSGFGVESLHEHDGLPGRERLQRRSRVHAPWCSGRHVRFTSSAPVRPQKSSRDVFGRAPCVHGPRAGWGGRWPWVGRSYRTCTRVSPRSRESSRPRSARPNARRARARIRLPRGAWARASSARARRFGHEQHGAGVADEIVELVGRRSPRSRHQPRPEPRASPTRPPPTPDGCRAPSRSGCRARRRARCSARASWLTRRSSSP